MPSSEVFRPRIFTAIRNSGGLSRPIWTPSYSQREILSIAYPAHKVPLIDPSDHDFKGERSLWALDYETVCEDGDTSPLCSQWCRQGNRRLFPFILASLMLYMLVR